MARTDAATRQSLINTARRAVDDPMALARAARIVQAALAQQRLTVEQLHSSEPVRRSDVGGDAA